MTPFLADHLKITQVNGLIINSMEMMGDEENEEAAGPSLLCSPIHFIASASSISKVDCSYRGLEIWNEILLIRR